MDWKKCTEENYPEPIDNVVVAYRLDNTWNYEIYGTCAYGWNVLCSIESYWLRLTEPKIK